MNGDVATFWTFEEEFNKCIEDGDELGRFGVVHKCFDFLECKYNLRSLRLFAASINCTFEFGSEIFFNINIKIKYTKFHYKQTCYKS